MVRVFFFETLISAVIMNVDQQESWFLHIFACFCQQRIGVYQQIQQIYAHVWILYREKDVDLTQTSDSLPANYRF